MTDNDFKMFREIIKEEIKSTILPIKEILEILQHKVSQLELFQHATAANIRMIKDQQSVMNEKLDNHTITLDQHTTALINLENEVGVYGDMYKLYNDNMKKLEKRLKTVEGKTGTKPPPELTLAELQ